MQNLTNMQNDVIFVTNNVFMKKYQNISNDSYLVNEPAAAYLSSTPSSEYQGADLRVIRHAREGIKIGYLLQLSDLMGLTQLEICKILHISLRTLQRYDAEYLLDSDDSSKVIQLGMLHRRGLDVFGDTKDFNYWLKTPMSSLEGKAPLDYLDTPFGFQLINQILGRIEHGVFA